MKEQVSHLPEVAARKFFRRLGVWLIFLFAGLRAAAQQPSSFTLGEEVFDGVQIYDVIQDDALDYWIATDAGLYRYDGYSFVKVAVNGIRSSTVFGFVKSRSGAIYCHNLNNQVFRLKDGRCALFYELQAEERSSDVFLHISRDDELLIFSGTILVFPPDGSPRRVAQVPRKYYAFPFQDGDRVISHVMGTDSLLVYEQGKFSLQQLKCPPDVFSGVLQFFSIGGKTIAMNRKNKKRYAFDRNSYALTSEQVFWPGSRDEFIRIYGENDQLWIAGNIAGVRMMSLTDTLTLSETYYRQYFISDVYRDLEGNLLLSTFYNGILVVPGIAIPDVLDIPGGASPVSIRYDTQLGLLAGTANGKLLAFRDGSFSTLSDAGSKPLLSLYSWPDIPFLLYDDGKIKLQDKTSGRTEVFSVGSLKDAAPSGDSLIYLALNTGLSKLRLGKKGGFVIEPLSSLHLRCYALDYCSAAGQVYVVSSDGLKMVDASDAVTDVLYEGGKVIANDVSCSGDKAYVAAGNSVLVCRNGQVVSVIPAPGRTTELLKISVSGNTVSGITPEGFLQFDLSGKVIFQLNRVYGFASKKVYDFDVRSGDTWICHSRGVQQLPPGLASIRPDRPLMRIREVTVDEHSVASLQTPGTFQSEDKKFRFLLSSPTLRNRENIRYHYQLSGYDEKPVITDYASHEIVYNALPPGDYVFSVRAENMGVFSEPAVYGFTITAPFYQRWWFNLLVAIALLLLVSLVYKFRLLAQNRKSRLLNELHASRLAAIQSQMNPHFIFNAMNSIQDLVLKGDIDNSYTYITKFSNLVRRTLNYSGKDFIDFDEEVELIELYLSLENLRFKHTLLYELETDGIEDILIPPMLIQPFIENALVHGLLHKEGEKRLRIRFRLDESLLCIIEDNGVGRAKAKEIRNRQRAGHESFSGQAIRKRLDIMSEVFGSEFGHSYEDLYENGKASGTRVRLTLPVKRKL